MQEDEVTEELLTFHEAVKHMQDEEEALMDYHCQLTDVSYLPQYDPLSVAMKSF